MDDVTEAYQHKIRATFAFLKETARGEDLRDRRLPLLGYDGHLIPVCELHAADPEWITRLACWRELNTWAYPTQFRPTFAGTAAWLRNLVLDVPDRLLFLAVDGQEETAVGHIGFTRALNDHRELKLENGMRGIKTGFPGIMTSAVRTVLRWAEEQFAPHKIWGTVFSDNQHMLRFLGRLGFQQGELLPLRRHHEGEMVSFRPLAPGDQAPPDKYHRCVFYLHGQAARAA